MDASDDELPLAAFFKRRRESRTSCCWRLDESGALELRLDEWRRSAPPQSAAFRARVPLPVLKLPEPTVLPTAPPPDAAEFLRRARELCDELLALARAGAKLTPEAKKGKLFLFPPGSEHGLDPSGILQVDVFGAAPWPHASAESWTFLLEASEKGSRPSGTQLRGSMRVAAGGVEAEARWSSVRSRNWRDSSVLSVTTPPLQWRRPQSTRRGT